LKPVQLKRKTEHQQKRTKNFRLEKEKWRLGHLAQKSWRAIMI
jgi:hypothetical protein